MRISEQEVAHGQKSTDGLPFLRAEHLRRTYPPTVAVDDLSLSLSSGEVLGLVGANGAGKSTLMKMLAGVIAPDSGTLYIGGQPVDTDKYCPAAATALGIRVVHQELSLCKNLTVYENFYVEQSQRFPRFSAGSPWRKQAAELAQQSLDSLFPGHGIDVHAVLATLSIAQQQMVEIARASSDLNLKLMILDEPTSSLPAEQTCQLQSYIKRKSAEGVSFVYISHRLKEITFLATKILIMQNGVNKWEGKTEETSELDMIQRMGEGISGAALQGDIDKIREVQCNDNVLVALDRYSGKGLKDFSLRVCGGEVVGLTGLEGNGQVDVLHEIFRLGRKKDARIQGKVAFVAGDRKKEGIFPLWSISDNTIISKIADGPLFRPLASGWVSELVNQWYEALRVKSDGVQAQITSLSGGNQQKVLIARAMALDADILLLDDPTRGVDVATKNQLYEVFSDAARNGKLVIWRTSDDAELEICTKLLVMREGRLAGEFSGTEVDHEELLKLCFHNDEEVLACPPPDTKATAPVPTTTIQVSQKKKRRLFAGNYMLALVAMLLLFLFCGMKSSQVFTPFGIGLLAVGFTPFVFAALSQTFVIGLGHIDLGVGAFMGLINVLCATVLDQNTGLGLAVLAFMLLLYSLQGVLICIKQISPIIVTLGMSFVWTGIALTIQEMPGGHTPEWLVQLLNFDTPLIQGIVLVLLVCIVLAIVFYRTKYGTVLRGFGNNEMAMHNSGWSKLRAYWAVYLCSGLFAMLGGIAFSVITGASDVNASATFTLLTVAAVVIGGGYFSGGVVSHIGAVFGAITLTLISVFLGLVGVSTDFTATIQGLVLIAILSLRLLKKEVLQ